MVEARDGQEALLMLRSDRPDLVLLDMNMPVMDGLETCRAMRADSQIPIIMLTVRNAEKDKVRALDAGADDYIVKPFGIQELLARVRAALRRSSSEQAEPVIVSKELSYTNYGPTLGQWAQMAQQLSDNLVALALGEKSPSQAASDFDAAMAHLT